MAVVTIMTVDVSNGKFPHVFCSDVFKLIISVSWKASLLKHFSSASFVQYLALSETTPLLLNFGESYKLFVHVLIQDSIRVDLRCELQACRYSSAEGLSVRQPWKLSATAVCSVQHVLVTNLHIEVTTKKKCTIWLLLHAFNFQQLLL